jgi:hypothetical protein
VGIQFHDIVALVTDSAAYCKKTYSDVLSAVLSNSTHVLCLAHIVNLAADVFQMHREFTHLCTLVAMIKSSLFKKPGRKSGYLKYIGEFIPPEDVKLPPVPVSTRWNSWFTMVIYHVTRVHMYEGFYKAEKGQGMAIERIIELLTHKAIYPEIVLHMYFIKENCQRIMITLTHLEAQCPLAVKIYNLLEDLQAYLKAGCSKETFGEKTDSLLHQLSKQRRTEQIKIFQLVFKESLK